MVGIPELNAVVTQKDELTPRLMILRVEPDGWDLPRFEAGQYVLLGLPPTAERCALSVDEEKPPNPDHLLRRAYSIASSSLNGEYMDFYIRLVSTGVLTPRLFALGVRDRLWMSGSPKGAFTLADVPSDRDVVLVATGTGLAPYMSMLAGCLPRVWGTPSNPGAPRSSPLVGSGLPVRTRSTPASLLQLHLHPDDRQAR